jgi:hypothetical protein
MMTKTRGPAPLRDVLYALSLAQAIPSAELVDEYVRRYPEYAEALVDWAIELAVDALRTSEACQEEHSVLDNDGPSPAVLRAVSHFQNTLFKSKHSSGLAETSSRLRNKPTSDPFSALDRTHYRALASAINANSVFLGKLRDRQIDPSTMTEGFQRRVAEELRVAPDVIVAYLCSERSSRLARQFYKADQKPESYAQESFEAAVHSSGLTSEQRAYLLSL